MPIINDGHSTLITFSENESIKFLEKTVTPPGLDAGGANDTTTMRNERFRTKQPKKLITMTDASAKVSYDPAVIDQIIAMLGVNQNITITYPDGETLPFWGWLDKFTPSEHVEGEQPTADISIIPSNQDDAGDEFEPAIVAAP
jgi:hypothetical protein